MRAINSAMALSKELDTGLKIIWAKDKGLNANFSDLFEFPADKNFEIYEPGFGFYNLPYTMRYPIYMNTIKNLLRLRYDKVLILNQFKLERIEPDSLKKYKNVFITSYSSQYYESEFDCELFKPKGKLRNAIDSISSELWDNTYGIHIRRGDNKESSHYSPTELFIKKIDEILIEEKDAHFYLATDSEIERKTFVEKYGERIITKNLTVGRNSLEGIESAVIDMFVLSGTKKIIGSYWSSFSEVAAMLGGVELEQVRKC